MNNLTPEIMALLNKRMLELLEPVDRAIQLTDSEGDVELMCVGMLNLVKMNLDRIVGPEVRKRQFSFHTE
jgi:hypothetical protein